MTIKSERHNVFTKETNKIALSSNDDKWIQSINSTETYAYGTSQDLAWKKEEIKYAKIIKKNNIKLFNFDYITKEYIKEYNQSWPEIPDHPNRI